MLTVREKVMTQPEPCKEGITRPLIGHKRCLETAGFNETMAFNSRKRLRRSSNFQSESSSPEPEEDNITHREAAKAPSGLSFREAAVEILKDLDRPLSAKELITRILSAGLVSTTGKTPDRTLASLIYSDIRTNGSKSRFRKVAKGLFGLKVRYYPAYDTAPPPSSSALDDAAAAPVKHKPKRSRFKTQQQKKTSSEATTTCCTTTTTTTTTSTSTSESGTSSPRISSCLHTCTSSFCLLCSSTTSDLHKHPVVPDIPICSHCSSDIKLNDHNLQFISEKGLCALCGTEQDDPCPNCGLPCCSSCIERLQEHHKLDLLGLCSKCIQTTCGFTPKTIQHQTTTSFCSQASPRQDETLSEGRRRIKWNRYSFGSADSKMPFRRTRNDEDENGFLFLQYFLYINRKRRLASQIPQRNEQPEDDCFACKNGGDLLVCDFPQCNKVYHKSCVDMDNIPSGQWFCPRHFCTECQTAHTTFSELHQCITCPVSYCSRHLPEGTTRYGSGIICSRCHYYLEKEITRF